MTSCNNHQVKQVSYEAVYATKYEFGEPIKEVYTFRCSCCGYESQLITKPSKL